MSNKNEVNDVTQKIIDYLLERDKKGLAKYGKSIADGEPPTGDWRLEIIEELLDAIQYSFRLNKEQDKKIQELQMDYISLFGELQEATEKITALEILKGINYVD